MKISVRTLTMLPLACAGAAVLFTTSALAGHPDKPEKPAAKISTEMLDDLEFSDNEARIIRRQIKAAQKRADKAKTAQPAKSLKQQLNDIELPSDAEIKQMQDQMPDLNALMTGMMMLANNDDMKKGMAKSAERLKETLDMDNFETKDGLPDLNAMMSAVIALSGDEELVGGLIEAVEPFAEFVDEIAPQVKEKD